MVDKERTIRCPHCGLIVPVPEEEPETPAEATPTELAPDEASPEKEPDTPAEATPTESAADPLSPDELSEASA